MRGNGAGRAAKGRAGRRLAVAMALAAVAGCGGLRLPVEALERAPEAADPGAPWPRLVDAPAPGADPGGPSAETGREVAEALTREALVGAARAETLAGPVIEPAAAARLQAARGR